MMKIKHFLTCLLSVFLLLFTYHLQAEALKTRHHNRISYITGGIGEDEVKEMQAHAKQFTLNLLFSEGSSGRWATNVNVNIYDENDQLVLRVVGAKPLLYVNLTAGNYTILANNNGEKLRHKLNIEDDANKKVILNWKDTFIEEDLIEEE